MQVSKEGLAFIAQNEGTVTKTYVDSAGVLTIGRGFTMRSAAFSAWAKQRWGRGLQRGDRMTPAEIDAVFPAIVEEEYAPPVRAKRFKAIDQHQFDASVDTVFNCGAGTLKDKWANAAVNGAWLKAATLLRSTRITAGGKRLEGLVKRRGRAAHLIETGDYGPLTSPAAVAPAIANTPDEIREYQRQLADLGYYRGVIDGVAGETTKKAVRAFQSDNPNLVVDGLVGKATRASLERAVRARQRVAQTAGGAGAAGGVALGTDTMVNMEPGTVGFSAGSVAIGIVVAVAVVLVVGGALLWRYRDEVQAWLNKRSRD